jgi:hypothetical protein
MQRQATVHPRTSPAVLAQATQGVDRTRSTPTASGVFVRRPDHRITLRSVRQSLVSSDQAVGPYGPIGLPAA